MSKKAPSKTGAMGLRLSTEKFFALASTLSEWRVDPVMQQMEADKDKGRILGFVKGLRLSAQLAYIIRDILSEDDVEVSWGHLVDDDEELCSPECDIIVHKPGYIQRWNGGAAEPIMDFRFIRCKNAYAVISCKSLAKSVDQDYCKGFAHYGVGNIILFAECCNTTSVNTLEAAAKKAGYSGFYYLYSWDSDGYMQQDPDVYQGFVKQLRSFLP